MNVFSLCRGRQVWLFGWLILLSGLGPSFRATAQPPNILVILADDLGYADVGFNGCPDIPTPNIDALATQGITFANGYVTHSYCSPSRAALLTGRYQQRFGHEANPLDNVVDSLAANQITLPQVLTNEGYATILVGKWHLGGNNPNQPPNRGFSDFFGFLGGGSGTYFLPTNTFLRRNLSNVVETNYLTHAFSREAVAYITTNAQAAKPFFMFLSYNAPHAPLEAPQDYLDRFPAITDPSRKTYAAMVSALDDGIGEVLQSLEDNGIATNTLVFFLSDNGGPTSVTTASNDPLRGAKGNVFEGGVHVPFVMRWPGRLPSNTNYTPQVSSLDIFATSVALAGGTMPSDRPMDGVDLMPFLLGQTSGVPHEQLFWRQGGGEDWAVREGDWKWLNDSSDPGDSLFQIQPDGTGEYTNLAVVESARIPALESAFSAWDAQLIEPLFGTGQLLELYGVSAIADNLGYRIGTTNTAFAYALTNPRYPPNTASNFVLTFRMEMINTSGKATNGYIVLSESGWTNDAIRAGISVSQSRLTITELETGGSNQVILTAGQIPAGTNEYRLTFDKATNSLTLSVGTVSVTRVLSRFYSAFIFPGYAVQNADTRFSVIETTHSVAEDSPPTYEWDADAGTDRNWSNNTNWTGGLEPTSINPAYINGSHTAVVSQTGERANVVYVGSTNQPSHGANSTGTVEQTGGDLSVGSSLYLGNFTAANGSYHLSGGTLMISNNLYVGAQGLGTMIITNAGAVTVVGDAVVGAAGNGSPQAGSRITVGGGSLTIGTALRIGGENTTVSGADGHLEQFGGTISVSGITKLGDNNDSTGRVTTTGGTLALASDLHVGENSGALGIMIVSGAATTQVAGVSYISRYTGSRGILSVSGGLFAANGSMEVGNDNSMTGHVVVTGGRLTSTTIVVGRQGRGEFVISGGSVTASTFALSFAPNGIGSLSMTGGRLVLTNALENLSMRRPGAALTISGGTIVAHGITVGSVAGHNLISTPATMTISGGTVIGGFDNSANSSNDFYVGAGSGRTGVVHITSGTLDVSRSNNDLVLGRDTNSMGLFIMSGGTVSVGGAIKVGDGGVGRYVISGGSLTNTSIISIGNPTSGHGSFEVVGGDPSIHVDGLNMAAMSELKSTLNGTELAPIYAAGTISVAGTLSVSNTGPYINGNYLIATSLNGTAISGTFAVTNWLNGITGTVSYADNRIMITLETTPVLLGVPDDVSVSCDDVPPPALVTVTNSCGSSSGVNFTETTNSGFCFSSYELIRVWSASNTCGYVVSATQVLAVADTTIPSITCPVDVAVACFEDSDPSLTGVAGATDTCDPSPVVMYADVPGAGFISRTWTAMDVCSNIASCVQIITITLSTNDTDADGMSDYEECVAGTSPTNNASVLKLHITPQSPGALLTFTSQVSRVYSIEYQAEPTNNISWPVLTNLPGTGGEVSVNDSTPADQRSYRIKTSKEP